MYLAGVSVRRVEDIAEEHCGCFMMVRKSYRWKVEAKIG
jgi:hypothetical protein